MTTRTKLFVAAVLVVAIGASVWLWHSRFSADFWPLDASRVGPNLVASVIQAVIVFLAAVLLYPPFRKAMEKIAHEANAELHEKIAHNAKLMQHIIRHHPDIPNEDRTGKLLVDLPPQPVKKAAAKKASTK